LVNVATKEEFDEFKKDIEARLYKLGEEHEKRLDDLLKAFGELTAHVDKIKTATYKRVDDIAEKSKSLFTRIKEAIEPVPE